MTQQNVHLAMRKWLVLAGTAGFLLSFIFCLFKGEFLLEVNVLVLLTILGAVVCRAREVKALSAANFFLSISGILVLAFLALREPALAGGTELFGMTPAQMYTGVKFTFFLPVTLGLLLKTKLRELQFLIAGFAGVLTGITALMVLFLIVQSVMFRLDDFIYTVPLIVGVALYMLWALDWFFEGKLANDAEEVWSE